jgi:aspartyl protease family protein
MRNSTLILPLFLLAPLAAAAAEVNVVGLTGGMAVVVINGGKPRTLRAGESTPEQVKLVSATSESAVFEIAGKRRTLTMGQSISVVSSASGPQRATIVGDHTGHFFTTATVNGASIRFLVDTGATLVTIGRNDARRAGVNYLAGERVVMQTASGVVPGYRVKFDTVRIGEIELNNVDGVVVDSSMSGTAGLLGMSFLNRTEMRRESDTLTLTRRY